MLCHTGYGRSSSFLSTSQRDEMTFILAQWHWKERWGTATREGTPELRHRTLLVGRTTLATSNGVVSTKPLCYSSSVDTTVRSYVMSSTNPWLEFSAWM